MKIDLRVNDLEGFARRKALKLIGRIRDEKEEIEDAHGEEIEFLRASFDGNIVIEFESGALALAYFEKEVHLMTQSLEEFKVDSKKG